VGTQTAVGVLYLHPNRGGGSWQQAKILLSVGLQKCLIFPVIKLQVLTGEIGAQWGGITPPNLSTTGSNTSVHNSTGTPSKGPALDDEVALQRAERRKGECTLS